jgi:N utilization substance protein A
MFDLKALHTTLDQLEAEKKIPKERILDAIEQALGAAYKKDYGKKGQIIRAKFNPENGDVDFFQVKIVVDETLVKPELTEEEKAELETAKSATNETENYGDEEGDGDERIRFNPEHHMYLEDAQRIKADAQLEEEIIFPLEAEEDFGRIAAQTAKQVIIQRIREAEKDAIMEDFADKQGEIINGSVQKVDRGNVFIDLGRATGILPYDEQIPGEFYRTGQRIKAYLYQVEETPRGINLKLSRSHPRFIEALFALESPEIDSGTVEIRSIAREAGSRSKIAVMSHDENVDPIGACVGQKGIRVTTVMSELGGEKIDIIPWSEDEAEFVAAALAPAKVLDIEVDDENRNAKIEVADDQLSLAIGKGGQNVRLAAKLTGWKIDIAGVEGEGSNDDTENEEAIDEAPAEEPTETLEEVVAEATAEDLPAGEAGTPAEEEVAEETEGTAEESTEEAEEEVAEA